MISEAIVRIFFCVLHAFPLFPISVIGSNAAVVPTLPSTGLWQHNPRDNCSPRMPKRATSGKHTQQLQYHSNTIVIYP